MEGPAISLPQSIEAKCGPNLASSNFHLIFGGFWLKNTLRLGKSLVRARFYLIKESIFILFYCVCTRAREGIFPRSLFYSAALRKL